MRIFTLLVTSCIISSNLLAQQKGDLLIGGTVGFLDYKLENNDVVTHQKNFYVAPTIGKFYANNRMAGINLHYFHSKFRDSLSANTYGGGLYLRQYQRLGKSFFVFAEEGINGYFSKYNDANGAPAEVRTTEKSVGLNFYPGLAYAINQKLQLEIGLPYLFSISYSHSTYKNETLPVPERRETHYFAVNTGFNDNILGNLSFGARWLIGRN